MKKLVVLTALAVLAAGAEEVAVQDGAIVIDEPGTHSLSVDATANAVHFRANATVTAGAWSGEWSAVAGAVPQLGEATKIYTGLPLDLLPYSRATIGGVWSADRSAVTVGYTRIDAGTATVQYQVTNTAWCICFKIAYTAVGDELHGEVLWARYTSDMGKFGVVWADGMSVNGTYNPSPFSSSTIYIHDFTLDENPRRTGTLTLTAPAVVTGSGSLLVPLEGTDGLAVTNMWDTGDLAVPQLSGEPVLVFPGLACSQIERISGAICGVWNGSTNCPSKTVALTRAPDGNSFTAQFHADFPKTEGSTTYAKAVKLVFSNTVDGVVANVLWAKYTTDHAKHGLDWDVTSGLSPYNSCFDGSTFGIGVRALHVHGSTTLLGPLPQGVIDLSADDLTICPASDMTISNSFRGTLGSLTLKGNKTAIDSVGPKVTWKNVVEDRYPNFRCRPVITVDGIDLAFGDHYALPRLYSFIVTNNATVTLAPGYRAADFCGAAWDETGNFVRIGPGCKVVDPGGDWKFGGVVKVEIDAGTLDIGTSISYLNQLTLMNGATVTGTRFVSGYDTIVPSYYLRTCGAEPCTIACCHQLAGRGSGWARCNYYYDLDADLHLQGALGFYGGFIDVVKRGPATLSLERRGDSTSGVTPLDCTFRIEEGALALMADGALLRTNEVTLAGGSLTWGACTNSLGTLGLAADSTLAVGEGCVTFADSSAAAWTAGAKLAVTGDVPVLAKGHVRFLGTGLTDEQLGAMRYNGELHVRLDSEGYLLSSVPPLMIIFR